MGIFIRHLALCRLEKAYASLIYPYVDYCYEVRDNTHTKMYNAYLHPKRSDYSYSDYLANTNLMFLELSILKLRDVTAHKCNFISLQFL